MKLSKAWKLTQWRCSISSHPRRTRTFSQCWGDPKQSKAWSDSKL